ncbi:MAG: hypothetical protein H6553_06680 [Chitinophagales bacterium]|nr:hypothetical protein [Chitinophagales bacterium]
MIFHHTILNALEMNHDNLKQILETYGVPVFPDVPNLRSVIYEKQMPFLQDLDEFHIQPMLHQIVALENFGGKFKAKRQEKKAGRQNIKTMASAQGISKKDAKKLYHQQNAGVVNLDNASAAQVLAQLPQKERIKTTLSALDKANNALGWTSVATNALGALTDGTKFGNAMQKIGYATDTATNALGTAQDVVEDNSGYYINEDGELITGINPNSNNKEDQDEKEKNDKLIMYVGIGAVVLLIAYLTFNKQ